MTTTIPVHLATTVKSAYGEIIASTDERVLSEDMIEVELRNGILVHAGWYADGRVGQGGKYRVYVQSGIDQLIPPLETTDPYEAASDVAALAAEYQRYPWVAPSNAGATVVSQQARRYALVG